MFFNKINNNILILSRTIEKQASEIDSLNKNMDFLKNEVNDSIRSIEKNVNDFVSIDIKDGSSPTIMTLLKKIAKLEGVVDAIEHRRSSTEVLNKLNELNELRLIAEREERDISILTVRVSLLKWILGENSS